MDGIRYSIGSHVLSNEEMLVFDKINFVQNTEFIFNEVIKLLEQKIGKVNGITCDVRKFKKEFLNTKYGKFSEEEEHLRDNITEYLMGLL